MASKGKGIADGKDSSGKRKRSDDDNGGKGRKNRSVLQFFEDAAVDDGDGDNDSGSDDFFNEDFLNDFNNMDSKVKSEPGRFDQVPFFPKEEELSGDELEKMLEERYRRGSGYVRYAEDDYESKRSVDKSDLMPSGEPTIWKVKCKVGREKSTVFCLIQKFVDLKVLGTKLQIISAFAAEHIKGFVFVEAERQSDVAEACNQLADVYFSLVTKVPSSEVGQLLVVKKRYHEVKEGTWARVKNGIYRGDLAQVVAVNNERKKATVKLIPRIDLQALTEKYGGGAISKRTKGSVPAARLISSSDLEEFRPLIQYRRDRDTGKMFEFLDSLMLKDGFLYKKVSIDSLSFWGINPSEDELQKFTISSNDESDNTEWLSQLYGEPKKKLIVNIDKGGGKGGGKGEGSSGSHEQSSFEVHDLVHFGKRDFGMVIGMEKDECYKILKDGTEGPVTLTLGQKDLKYVPLEKKFTALDHRMKTISINDIIRILEGPIKGREGIVKQVYRGVIFLYDENDLDNAYFCSKSQMSEKVKHSETVCHGKDEGGLLCFEDVPSSPKSPLSPKKPWQRGNNSDVGRTEKAGIFSVGQSLRIRIGPLKGYLCRVLAIRYSDVTVKLDSQHKVLTVKREHLSEVRGKSSASSIRDDPESSSPFKPFDLLGTEGNTNDWLQQASGSADGDGWNVGGMSSERGAWPAFPSSGASLQASTAATDLPTSGEDTAWLSKVVDNEKAVDNSDQVGGWGTSAGGWDKANAPVGDQGSSWNVGGCSFGQGKADNVCETDPWEEGQKITKATNSWGSQSAEKGQSDSWHKRKRTKEQGGWNNIGSCSDSGSSGLGKQKTCTKSGTWGGGTKSVEQSIGKGGGVAWAEPKCSSDPAEDSWGKAADGWGKKNSSSDSGEWGSSAAASQSQAVALAETQTGWGQRQGQIASGGWKKSLDDHHKGIQTFGTGTSVHETWTKGKDAENKGSDVPCEDPWGKVVDKRGDKDSSNRGNEWGSSTDKLACDNKGWGTSSVGGWTNSQERTEAGGWKSSGDGGAGDGWSKSTGFDADNKGGNDSWGQSKKFEDDRGFSRGRGPSGRGRVRGRDQFGRGRSFGRDQFSGSNQDIQGSSGSKDWKDQHGSSRGNSSVENGLISSWDKGKSWKDNKGDGSKGWNKSNESDNDAGGWSLEKSSSQIGWNVASSGWGTSYQTSEDKAMDGWKKDATSTSSGWTKGGDLSQGKSWGSGSEGRGSWSKPPGNNSWEKPKNSGNDQEVGWGQGSGGRRGGRGFCGGRDQFGRGGGGRSGGRGGRNNEGSCWSKGEWSSDKTIGENNVGGNSTKSWGSGDGVGGKGWSKAGEGGSSWGSGGNDQKGGWDNDTSRNTGQGGSSWGNPLSSHSSDAGGWSSDKTIGENDLRGNLNKSWGSSHGVDGKGWSKAGESGSSWVSGENSQKGGWDNDISRNTGQGGSSWGKQLSGHSSDVGGWSNDKAIGETNVGGNSIKSWGSGDGAEGKGWSKAGEGGSSWVSVGINIKGGRDNDTSRNTGQGGSSWGKPPSGRSSVAGGWSCDKTIGEYIGGNSNKSWGSGDGAEGKGWSKTGEGGSSWSSGSDKK